MTTSRSELGDIRARLIDRWQAIPDHTPADQVDELARQAEVLVALISWVDEHPAALLTDYRAERDRLLLDGPQWSAVRIIVDDSHGNDALSPGGVAA